MTARSNTELLSTRLEKPRVRVKAHESDTSYVLMSAAHNEEATVGKTIESVLNQTIRPKRWVIVSDRSTDRTDEIVQKYAAEHDFIRFLQVTRAPGRSFASKVVALLSGTPLLEGVPYRFIGNVDSDITIEPFYFERLIERLLNNPQLGIVGGFVCDEVNGGFHSRKTNSIHSVAHAAQLVRRECYEAIGGYAVLEYGGEDWHAQTSAKMKGWEIEALPELKILHYRRTGTHSSLLRYMFREGKADYSFGSYAPFEVFKCMARLPEKPFVAGAIVRLGGFTWSCVRKDKIAVSDEFAAFLRKEQKGRVLSLLRGDGIRTWLAHFSRGRESEVQRGPSR